LCCFLHRARAGACGGLTLVCSHIRRSDKRDNHYRYRNASSFILAGLSSRVVPGHIYLCSDDKHALAEFKQNWTAVTPLPLPPVTFRFSKERPDYPRSFYTWDKREETYLDVLADVQLFALAKVFVGPQSSNMGRMACLLRDYVGCYNVEADAQQGWKCAWRRLCCTDASLCRGPHRLVGARRSESKSRTNARARVSQNEQCQCTDALPFSAHGFLFLF